MLFADVVPAMQDVRWDDAPALPVSLLLEYALSVGDWIQPEPPAQLHWRGLRDLEVELEALACRDGELVLLKRGAGGWRDGEWLVDVELAVEPPQGSRRDLARLALVYAREPQPHGREVPFGATGERETFASRPPLTWKGFVYRAAQWHRAPQGVLVGLARAVEPADLWATPFVPETRLPGAELENVFRAQLTLRPEGEAVRTLRLSSLERFASGSSRGTVIGAGVGEWSVLDESARVVVHLTGLAYS